MTRRPVIGISCCLRSLVFGDYPPTPHHVVFHKYVDYVTERLDGIALLLPAVPGAGVLCGWRELVSRIDGVLLTGSPSNVGLRRGAKGFERISPKGSPDYARDETTIKLVQQCLDSGVPVLGICRGMQEINIALGGGLHEELWAVEGFQDHRSDKTLPFQQRYQPRHSVSVIQDSMLDDLLKAAGTGITKFDVNSLHGQGVSTLGDGVSVQARSSDGVIEAIAVREAAAFTMGVQWHIEWGDDDQMLDGFVTAAFRTACYAAVNKRAGS